MRSEAWRIPGSVDACIVHFLLFYLIVIRRRHSVVGVLARRLVKRLDVIEQI